MQTNDADQITTEVQRHFLAARTARIDDPSYINVEAVMKALSDAEAEVRKLEAINPSHAALARLKSELADFRRKGEANTQEKMRGEFQSLVRVYERHLSNAEECGTHSPSGGVQAVKDARKIIATIREGGHAATLPEVGEWLTKAEVESERAGRVAEARVLLREVADEQTSHTLVSALKYVPELLDAPSPKKALEVWQALQRLARPLEKFADLPEVAEAREGIQAVGARIDLEVRPLLEKAKVDPLIEKARPAIDFLNRSVDNRDEEEVLRARRKLRSETKELRSDFGQNPDARALLAEVDEAFRRCDEEMGDAVVLRELPPIETQVKRLLRKIALGLATKNPALVSRFLKPLAAKSAELQGYGFDRAARLRERCEDLLRRAGIAPAGEPEPLRFEIEVAWDMPVRELLERVEEDSKRYRDEYAEGMARYEDVIDLEAGSDPNLTGGAWSDIESASRHMIECARRIEANAKELKKLSCPLAEALLASVPPLVKRAQAWKDTVSKKFEYSNAIFATRSKLQFAADARTSALEGDAQNAASQYGWRKVLEDMAQAREELKPCFRLLPDDHDEADDLAAEIEKWRAEAEKCLIETCVGGARRAALTGESYDATMFLEALREALPKAAEIQQIEKELAETADARAKAEQEAGARDAMIEARLAETAKSWAGRFDSWRDEMSPIRVLAQRIVANPEGYKGKWVLGQDPLISDGLYDDYFEIGGEIYHVEWDAEVRRKTREGMDKLAKLYVDMVAAVQKKHGLPARNSSRSYMVADVRFLGEIVGVKRYTPVQEVRDGNGMLLGKIEGTPYPVPALVMRGFASKRHVVIAGQGASLDEMDFEGILP